MNNHRRWSRLPLAVLLAAMIGYAGLMSWFSIGRAANFNAGWYDLGIMAQTVWRAGHGYGLSFTNPEAGAGGVHGLDTPRTAIHTDYILWLLAPLSWLGETWKNILVFQAIVVAAGAFFIWRLAGRWLGSPWWGTLLAVAYLAYSPLQFANLFEFHAVVLAVTFFLAAAEALSRDRWREMWLWASLALIAKEQVGITLGLFLGFLWWRQRQSRRALWTLGICLAWVILQFAVVIPLSRPAQATNFTSGKFYPASEGSFAVIKRLAHPDLVIERLNTGVHRSNVVQLLAPFGGVLPLLSPLTYLMAPEVLLYWLSDSPNMQTLYLHYQALFIPFIVVGTILGWRTLVGWIGAWRPKLRPWAMAACGLAIFVGSGYMILRASPWPWSPVTRWPLVAWRERQAPQVAEARGLLPDRASAAVTQNLGSQVSGRPRVTLLPTGLESEKYVFILQRAFTVDTKTNDKRLAERDMLELVLSWMQSQPEAYHIRYQQGRVWLFERVGASTVPLPAWPEPLLGR